MYFLTQTQVPYIIFSIFKVLLLRSHSISFFAHFFVVIIEVINYTKMEQFNMSLEN